MRPCQRTSRPALEAQQSGSLPQTSRNVSLTSFPLLGLAFSTDALHLNLRLYKAGARVAQRALHSLIDCVVLQLSNSFTIRTNKQQGVMCDMIGITHDEGV